MDSIPEQRAEMPEDCPEPQAGRQNWLTITAEAVTASASDLGELAMGLAAIVAALAVVAVLIGLAGINPIDAYAALVNGSLGSLNGISETLVRATPLMLIGLGIAVAFRAGMWNIGAEGQLLLGAIGATVVGLYLPPLPGLIHIPLVMLGGFALGLVWAAIPGYLKAKRGVNEIVVTIMMNYLAVFLLSYLVTGPLRDNSRVPPMPQSPLLATSALLPKLIPATRAHAGFLIAILAAIAVWFVLERTTLGYEIKAVGANPTAARYGGINAILTATVAMMLSGGLAGLAGMGEISGVHRYLLEGISPGYGYLAIAVALFGGLNPVGIVFSALFFGALMVGAESMQRAVGVPIATIYMLQGLVVIFVLARRVLRRRRVRA